MNRDKNCPILAKSSPDKEIYQSITSAEAGWNHLNFMARTLKPGQKWIGDTGNNEYLFVLLGGNFLAETSAGTWKTSNGRKDVFSGLPHALYLPQHTKFEITPAGSFLDIACGWCTAEQIISGSFYNSCRCCQIWELNTGEEIMPVVRLTGYYLPAHRLTGWFVLKFIPLQETGVHFPPHKHDTRKTDPVIRYTDGSKS